MSMLKSPFHQVKTQHGSSYGGNQAWLPYEFLKSTGCGIISAADVLLHLQGVEEISQEEYQTFAKKLWMNYLPVIPGFGMNGFMLMIGLNLYFKTHLGRFLYVVRRQNLGWHRCAARIPAA